MMNQDDPVIDTLNRGKAWSGVERRAADAAAFQLMVEANARVEEHKLTMSEKIDDLKDELDALRVRQDSQFHELRISIDQLKQSMTAYMTQTPDKIVERIEELIDEAFPNDPEFPDASPSEKRKLHRRYHANLIKAAIKNIERQQSLLDKIYAHLAQNAVTLIGLALVAYLGLNK